MADYSSEEVSTICGEIQKRIKGGMNDQDFNNLKQVLTPPGIIHCRQCYGTGIYETQEVSGLFVCRMCDYHFKRGRTLSLKEPESITRARRGT